MEFENEVPIEDHENDLGPLFVTKEKLEEFLKGHIPYEYKTFDGFVPCEIDWMI